MARIQEASGCTAGSSLAAMQEPCSCSHHGAGGMALTAAMPVHEKGKGGRSGVRAPLTCCSPTHADVQLLVVLGMVVNGKKRSKVSGYICLEKCHKMHVHHVHTSLKDNHIHICFSLTTSRKCLLPAGSSLFWFCSYQVSKGFGEAL